MSNKEKFIYVDVTTRIKVNTADSEYAKEYAKDAVLNMTPEEYEKNTTYKISGVREEVNTPKKYRLVNKDLDVWAYEIDNKSFMLDYGLSVEDEELENEPELIDLEDSAFDFDYVMQSPVVHVDLDGSRAYVELEDSMSDLEIAIKIYAELKGL